MKQRDQELGSTFTYASTANFLNWNSAIRVLSNHVYWVDLYSFVAPRGPIYAGLLVHCISHFAVLHGPRDRAADRGSVHKVCRPSASLVVSNTKQMDCLLR